MCGILACLSETEQTDFRYRLNKIKHRGPDETTVLTTGKYSVGFVRNAINNPLQGRQPIEDGDWVHVHNGEFYNDGIENDVDVDEKFLSAGEWGKKPSDSHLLRDVNDPKELDGVFAYCSYNRKTETLHVARDFVGVVSLYYVESNGVWFASEAKALAGLGEIVMFPPNTVMTVRYKDGTLEKTERKIYEPFPEPTLQYDQGRLCNLLETSVRKRITGCSVPWGIALSGGLDSTYFVTLLRRIGERRLPFGYQDIHTFTIGLKGSPDLLKAREVAKEFFTVHHEIEIGIDEAMAAVSSAIHTLETYDVTTVRAGTMNYLLAKYMKFHGIKMALSGEGSDEIFGGYLYNHYCPGPDEMHRECVKKIDQLHYYDCLRCHKAFAAFGIEVRVPFLDKALVDYVMAIDPTNKLSSTHPDGPRAEKHILRQCHIAQSADKIQGEQFSYRQKDQFSDAVGEDWINTLVSSAEEKVSDEELAAAHKKYPFQTPLTKEAYYYRTIFHMLFNSSGERFVLYDNNTVACSTSTGAEWCDVKRDPSGNFVKNSLKL